MKFATSVFALLLAAAIPVPSPASAAPATPAEQSVTRAGNVEIVSPWSRNTNPGQRISAVYLVLRNTGAEPIALESASVPVAGQIVLHDMVLKNGFPQMVTHEGPFVVEPGGTLELRPGGKHLMLVGMVKPLRAGEVFPLTLNFSGGTSVVVDTLVWDAGIIRAGEPPR